MLRVTLAGGGLHQVCVGAGQQRPPVTIQIQNFVTYEYIQKQKAVLKILEREKRKFYRNRKNKVENIYLLDIGEI